MINENEISMCGLIGVGSHFEGEIEFEGLLRIDGFISGKIYCRNETSGIIIISELAVVEADIITDVLIVSGRVTGNIQAIERVEIRTPGRIEGKVSTSDFMVDEGALFQGECIMLNNLTDREKKAIKIHHLVKNE